MSVLNPASDDESPECPLCMEFLELDDISFYPCACGYQICRFCWNKIRTEGNGQCPACRSPYSENPADFKPLSAEEMARIKAEKRQKDQAKKQKISENRKHLANVRVVQRNLVFVVGLSPRLADPDVLKKPEYFGKFGKMHKVVINHSTSYAGNQNQGPSASAYVTYLKSDDALRAIQAVNNIFIDGRTLKASLGTTKYCSHFMKNQSCPKHDCMYLHELGDEAASFTKEEMQQGKHTDYERALHEEVTNSNSSNSTANSNNNSNSGGGRGGGGQQQSVKPPSVEPADRGEGDLKNSKGGGAAGKGGGKKSRSNSPREAGWANLNNHRQTNGTREESDEDSRSDRRNADPPSSEGGRSGKSSAAPAPAPSSPVPMSASSSPSSRGATTSSSSQDSSGGGLHNHHNHLQPSPPPQQQQPPAAVAAAEAALEEQQHLKVNGGDHSSKQQQQPSRVPPPPPGMTAPATTASVSSPTPHHPPSLSSFGGMAAMSGIPAPVAAALSILDDDLEDDLGFDPFRETQKALAEMLESETRQQHQVQQQQQQRRVLPQQQQLDQLPIHQSLQQQSSGVILQQQQQQSNGRHPFMQQQQQPQQPPLSRPKAPPPGFASAHNPGLPRFNGGLGGFDGLANPLPSSSSSSSPFPGNDLLNRMGKVSPPPGVLPQQQSRHMFAAQQQQQQQQASWQQGGKDWQDGLRALLPNINVSFGGSLPSETRNAPAMQSGGGGGALPRFPREEQLQDRRFNNMPPLPGAGHDLSLLDPAIVNASSPTLPPPHQQRSDSPGSAAAAAAGWLRGPGLEHHFLSNGGEMGGSGGSNGFGKGQPLPQFAGLSLGGGGGQSSRWNGSAEVRSELGHPPPPPPGFSLNRMQPPQSQPPPQQPQPPFLSSEGLESKGFF